MNLFLQDSLPLLTIAIAYHGAEISIPKVLIDTGSGTTILSTDIVAEIGIIPSPEDILHTIRGVGGREVVFRRKLDSLRVGNFDLPDFSVDIGGMDYGFELNGILGMDFLTTAGAIIDLGKLIITFAD